MTRRKKPTLGHLIAEARRGSQKSQRQVEMETGIDRNQLSRYENDRETMRVSTLERLSVAIGLELPWDTGRYRWADLNQLAS